MSHRDAHVAQYRRVGQVALQTAYRQFLCQELQHSICHTHVTLRVLEVYGVYLMWHSTAPHLAGLDFLLEVLHRDVHPEVAIQVNDNGINAAHSVENGSQPVVVRNLGCPLLTLQTELLADETVAELTPVILRISYMVGIIVTRSTTKLCGNRCILQTLKLLLQTIDINHYLLAQTCR